MKIYRNYLQYVPYVTYSSSMPDVKVYIRKKNLDKWLAIEKPAEWINALLENSGDTSEYGKERDVAGEPFVTVLSEKVPVETPFKKGANLCKIHGLPLTAYGRCLQKGCKYA